MKRQAIRFESGAGEVSGLLLEPAAARAILVMAHGAGAGLDHPFMEAAARSFAGHGIATLRYQFPYRERGEARIDPQPVLLDTVRAVVAIASRQGAGLPCFAGGKSMGGRMTSLAAAERPLAGVRGLVFVGFPLHPAGRPGVARAEHLRQVELPMLFLQGTRDALAPLDLLRPVCQGLGSRATLHVVDGADHSFHVLKRSGRSDASVLEELAATLAAWVDGLTDAG